MGRSRNGKREVQREVREPAPRVNRAPELRGLCLVLFGMPAAGKSSLLGALAQAAQTQPMLLGGEMKDLTGELEELKRRVYQEKAQETLDEIVSYPIAFQPQDARKPFDVTLIDCDGRVASTYLKLDRTLRTTYGSVNLATAIEQADALLLVVDASAESAQLKNDFAQFSRFLRALEDYRSQATEVAGLPVYLVLTKCDLLAEPKDTASQWLQRVEEGKRRITQRFKEFLAQEAHRESRAFGQIDLHVWATAVKRPALADKPAKPLEPFGVAELFRQCFASGLAFDQAQKQAERRLQAALLAIVGFLAIIISAGTFFLVTRPSSELTALENQAQMVLPARDSSTRERLRGPLEERLKQLEQILNHAEFPRLPEILKDRVHSSYDEIKTYMDLAQRYQEANRPISGIKSMEELVSLDKALKGIQIPEIYAEQWKDLELKRDLEAQREKAALLRLRVAEVEGMLRKRLQEGNALLEARPKGLDDPQLGPWLAKLRDFLAKPMPEATSNVPGLPEVRYQQLYEFEANEALMEALRRTESTLINTRQKLLGFKSTSDMP